MADGLVTNPVPQITDVPKTIMRTPWLAIGIGFAFLVLVLIIESWKPGVITNPIRKLLGMARVKA